MGGDPPAPRAGESTDAMMKALTANLPAYMQAMNSQVGPQAQAQLNVAQQTSPAYAQLMQDLYSKYAPELAKTGAELDRINRTGASDTDLEILRGSGGTLAREGQALDRELNKEYYDTRAKASDSIGQLLGSINLDDANPEAERLINQENARSGNLANSSATGTVSNALSFGSELQKRRDSLGNAISVATNFMTPAVGQFNPINTALNRNTTSTGNNQFTGVQNPGDQAYQSGQGLMGQIGQFQTQRNDINANRRDTLDRVNETMSSLPSA